MQSSSPYHPPSATALCIPVFVRGADTGVSSQEHCCGFQQAVLGRERERKKERGKRRSKDSGGGSVSPAQPHFNSKTLLRKAGREPLQHRLKAQQFPSITHPCLAGSITQPKACRQTEGVKLVISQLRSERHRKCSNLHFILRIILTLRSQARDNAEAVPATILKHRDGNKTQVVFQDRH